MDHEEEKQNEVGRLLKLKTEDLGSKYECFRFVDPKTEEKILWSMKKDGQLSPLIVQMEADTYQVLDGFKRLRACRQMAYETLEVRVIGAGGGVGKAAMVRQNLERKGLCPLEEGLIVRAMHRQDGLEQLEIAGLVNRHKSWVCRRIALVDRLGEEVTEHMRLGLISASVGRELSKLPRGNQAAVMAQVEGLGLSSRETEKLVSILKSMSSFDGVDVKGEAEKILLMRTEKKEEKGRGQGMPGIKSLLWGMKNRCQGVIDFLEENKTWVASDATGMGLRAKEAAESAQLAVEQLRQREVVDG